MDCKDWADNSLVLRPASLLAVWRSGRRSGIIYHVSDVEGREKVERTYM